VCGVHTRIFGVRSHKEDTSDLRQRGEKGGKGASERRSISEKNGGKREEKGLATTRRTKKQKTGTPKKKLPGKKTWHSVKTDSVKTDSVKTDSVKTDSVKTDFVKTDSVPGFSGKICFTGFLKKQFDFLLLIGAIVSKLDIRAFWPKIAPSVKVTQLTRGELALKRSAAARPSKGTLVRPLWRAAGSGAKAPPLAARPRVYELIADWGSRRAHRPHTKHTPLSYLTIFAIACLPSLESIHR